MKGMVKTMKKTLRKIIASVLLLVMLFSISATAVFAIGEANVPSGGGSSSLQQQSGGAGGTSGGVDLGWCSVTYDNDELNIVWYHNLDSAFSATSEQIKMLANELIAGIKTIVIEDIKGNITGLQPGETVDPSLNSVEQILKNSLDSFVKEHSNGESDVEAYVDMFKTMLSGTPDGDELIEEFVDHICNLVSLAVRGGYIALEDLPKVEDVSDLVTDTVDDYINEYVDIYMESVISDYVDYLKTPVEDREELSELLSLVDTEVIKFVRNELALYVSGETTHFDDEIESYLNTEVDVMLDSMVDVYLDKIYNGTEPTGAMEKYAVNLIDSYFNRAIDNYVKNELGQAITDPTAIDSDVFTLVHNYILAEVKAEIDAYADYKYGDFDDKPMLYDIIDDDVRDMIASQAVPGLTYDNFTSFIDKADFVQDLKGEVDANPNNVFDQLTEHHLNTFLADRNEVIKNTVTRTKLEEIVGGSSHDAIIAEIHALINTADADYKSTLTEIIGELSDSEIREMLAGVVSEQGFDLNSILADLKSSVLGGIDPSYKTKAIAEFLGMDEQTYENNLGMIIASVEYGYENVIADLEDNANTELTVEDLLGYLRSIKVKYNDNLEKVLCDYEDGGIVFKKDALVALIGELPKPGELANMPNDEMSFSWAVEILTSLSDEPTSFSVNLSVGAGYKEIRTIAAVVANMLDVSRGDDGRIVVNLKMFDSVTEIIADVLASEDVNNDLKRELFALFEMNVDELYDYFINEFSYQDYISIINVVDFEALLLEFGIDEISNERIVERISNEGYFNKFKSLVNKLYSFIPDEINTDITLIDLYRGNGNIGLWGDYTFDLTPIIEKISNRYGSFIAKLFDETTVEVSMDVSASFENFHSVEFLVNGNRQKIGLLPAGADHIFFYGSDRYQGYKIVSWSDADGIIYDSMPNKDVVLNATLEELDIALDSDVSKVYDGAKETLSVSVIYSYDNPTFTYRWYKNGALIEGATSATLDVVNVLDSGVYYCEVDVVDGELSASLTSNTVVVSITPAPKTIEDYPEIYWDYVSEFTYDGTEKSVSVSENYSDIALDTISGIKGTNAGTYNASASYKMLNTNYEFIAPAVVNLTWIIVPAEINDEDVEFVWDYDVEKPFVYEYGTVRIVSVSVPENLKVDLVGNSASTAGHYVTTGFISSSNPNYVWVGQPTVSLSWQIKQAEIDLSTATWDYTEETEFTYSGNAYKVELVGIPEDVALIYSNNEKINAGTYTASVIYDPNAPENANYLFKGVAPECEWTIEKATLTDILDNYTWTYDASTNLVYNGESQSIYLNVPEGIGVTVEYTGNVATDAGDYTATAVLIPTDAENFVISGVAEFTTTWSIGQASYDMSGVSFSDKTVYYNGEAQGIQVEGAIPDGVTVSYSQAYTEPGEYEMIANFMGDSKNYTSIPSMTATLTILPVIPDTNDYSYSDSEGNVIVSVSAANGIPSDHKLNVNNVAVSYVGFDFGDMFGSGKNGKLLSVYDIHFAVNGTENPVSDVFTVTLAIPATFDGDQNNLRVVYIAENGDVTDMEAMVSGGALVFETTHFSVYGVVEIVDRVEEEEPVDLTWLVILLVVIIVLAIIAAVVVFIRRRRGNDPEDTEPEAEPTPDEPAPEAPAEETPAEEAPAEEAPAEEAPAEKAPAEEAPAEEAPAEEAPAEEAPVEEAPAEEAPAEEAPVEEAPVEEAPAEEAPAEEAPAEEEPPKPNFVILPDGDDGASISIDGKVVPVRYRSSFMSRLIQSEPPIQDYYNTLKNALLSYKGVKARMSWNCESFNKGRAQCAKLNVKGRTFLVYLGLNLDEYNVNKYHFSDASDKPKFEKVPMMLKIRSDRSLKYALELIDEVMKKNGIEKGKDSNIDFHMPYETTAELARRDLVKLILPAGVSLSDGMYLSNTNVGAMLDEASNTQSEEKGN